MKTLVTEALVKKGHGERKPWRREVLEKKNLGEGNLGVEKPW